MDQQIRFCTTPDGVRIAYATSGQGPPLVKAASYLTHLEFDWQSPVWRHWLEELGSQHTLIRYDERGCGLSDWNVDAVGVDVWVRDLEAVVDQLELERFPILGISQGGPVAMAYAVRHPERVSHLILYGTYARGRFHRNKPEDEAVVRIMLDSMRVGWGQENPAFRQLFTSLFLPDGSPEQIEWFNELQRVTTSPENAIILESAFYDIDVTDLAPQVEVPTLVLHVRNDALIPFEEGRLLAAMIPGARFVPLDGQNHLMLEDEVAWQCFVTEIYDFMSVKREVKVESSLAKHEMAGAHEELTSREEEVLDLLARGYSNAEIAEALVLSPKTIRNYVSNVFGKLGVATRGEAIVKARGAGYGRDNR